MNAPRILVTRPRAQAAELAAALRAWGAQPVLFPTVEIAPPADPQPLERALTRLPEYDWLVFTSVNAVEAVYDRLGASSLSPPRPRIAAVGPATAAAVTRRGNRVEFLPTKYVGAQLGRELPDVEGRRVLIPQGDQAAPALGRTLETRGALVERVEAYRTAPPEQPDPAELADLAMGVDAAIFTSGSAVRHLFSMLGTDATRLALAGAVVACIGPVTADVARALGLQVHVEPAEHTVPAVVGALRAHLAGDPAGVRR